MTEEKKEERANALFGLMVLGGLAMAVWARIGHIHTSLAKKLGAWVNRRRVQVTKQASQFLSSDEGREIMPHVTSTREDEQR